MPSVQHTIMSEFFFRRHKDLFAPYLAKVGISEAVFERGDIPVPECQYVALLESIAADGSPNAGLELGVKLEAELMGPMGHAISHAESIGQCLNALSRYIEVFSQSTRICVHESTHQLVVQYRFEDPLVVEQRQDAEFAVSGILAILRRNCSHPLNPIRVDFEHARPSDINQHLRVFGCPVHFNRPTNKLYFPHEVASYLTLNGNPRMYEALAPYLEEQLKSRAAQDPLLLTLTRYISEHLDGGDITLARASAEVSLSPRTLQRRLQKANTEFNQLVDDVRRNRALSYISNLERPISDIAWKLGYAESSAFSRAFRRWTGQTPLQYRKSCQT